MATTVIPTPKTRLRKRSSSEEIRDIIKVINPPGDISHSPEVGNKLIESFLNVVIEGTFDIVEMADSVVPTNPGVPALEEPVIVPFSANLTANLSTNCTLKFNQNRDNKGGDESGPRSNGFCSEVDEPQNKQKAAEDKSVRKKQDRKPWTKAEEQILSVVALEMGTGCELKDLCNEAIKRGIQRPPRGIEKKFKRIYGELKWSWKKDKAKFIDNAASRLQYQLNSPAQHLKRSREHVVNLFIANSPTKKRRVAE